MRAAPGSFYLQHTAGMGDLVAAALRSDLQGLSTSFRDPSSMIVTSTSTPSEVEAVPYVKNSFIVLATTADAGLHTAGEHLVRDLASRQVVSRAPRRVAFRVMASLGGHLTPLPGDLRRRLESAIGAQTQGWVQARGSCQEYWLIGRRDLPGIMLCRRMSPRRKAPPAAGSLGSDLAQLLVRASEPDRRDVFLDPCAGSGSLVAARLTFASRRVIYSDVAAAARRSSRDRSAAFLRDRVEVLTEDALVLPSIADGSVDAIVTDPPWGEYESVAGSYDEFIDRLAGTFDRVLHPRRGRAVLLVSRQRADDFSSALDAEGLAVRQRHEILVNGHPATVLVSFRPRAGDPAKASPPGPSLSVAAPETV